LTASEHVGSVGVRIGLRGIVRGAAPALFAALATACIARADWIDSFPGGEPEQFWNFAWNPVPLASGSHQFAPNPSDALGNLTITAARPSLPPGALLGFGVVPTESFAGRGVVVQSTVNPSGAVPGVANVGVAGMVNSGPGTGYLATISTNNPGVLSTLSLIKATGVGAATSPLGTGTFSYSVTAPYIVELEAIGPVIMARTFSSSGGLLGSVTSLDSHPLLAGFAGVAAWEPSGASASGNWGTTSARGATPNGGLVWAPNGSLPLGIVPPGTWTATSLTWISSSSTTAPVRWDPTKTAVFAANGTNGGAVSVSGVDVRIEAGLRFVSNGYSIESDPDSTSRLVLAGNGPILEVDGAPRGFLPVATIGLPLTGTSGFRKQGGGVLALTGANTYSGNTTIANGILSIASTAALPGWNTPGRSSVEPGAALAVRNGVTDQEVAGILATGNMSGGSFGFDTFEGNRTFGIDINESIGLRKIGTHRLTLTGSNTYDLGTVIHEGQLGIATTGALPGWDQPGGWSVDPGAALVVFNGVTDAEVADLLATGNLGDGGFGFDTTAGDRTYAQVLSGTLSLHKSGPNTLTLSGANTYTGSTTISSGTLAVANAAALGGTNVTVDTGATLAIPPGTAMKAPAVILDGGAVSAAALAVNSGTGITSLAINAGTIAGSPVVTVGPGGHMSLAQDARVTVAIGGLSVDETAGGGRLDLGAGQVSIAAGGISAADLRADIIAGRNNGAWSGTTGITSSTAAETTGRAVGYVVNGDTSARISFAAFGDVDLNGQVNVFDLVGINSGGAYGAGTSSVWSQGDFNYDGVTNVFDLVAVNTAGAYGQGNYFPPAPTTASGLGSVAAVPEPGGLGLMAASASAGVAALRYRRVLPRRLACRR
jgi:fibronectin-binding autotransporter adhesin